MGIIDTIKNTLPLGGKPESDLTVSDFESDENDSGGRDNDEENSEDSEESEDGEEQENGQGNSEDSEESEDGEEQENGQGDSEDSEESEDGEEQENGQGDSENNEESEDGENTEDNSDRNSDNDEDVEDMKEEMDNSSAERDMDDWEGYDGDSSSNLIEQHYNNLQEQRAEPSTEIGLRKEERDKRIEEISNSVDAETVLNKYEERFADEIKEAFRKIKTREAPKAAEYGQRINMRGVIRRRSGDPTEERLYLEMDQSEIGDRCITVVVDSSASIDELEVKLALMALADACEMIGDRFTATNYSSNYYQNNKISTNLITAPTEKFKNEHLNSFKSSGCTPTASGINDGRALSDITPNNEDVVIVITDGIANVDMDNNKYRNSRNNDAMDEAAEQVKATINEGKRVIGLGVGSDLDDKSMKKIFGNSYIRTDMDNIADSLVDIYRSQMKTVKN